MNKNAFPASPSNLADRPEVLTQIRKTFESFRDQASRNPDVIARFSENPIEEFLKYAPEELRTSLSTEQKEKAKAILLDSEHMGRIQETVHAINYAKQKNLPGEQLLASGWGSAFCQIGLWTAIVLALGAAIAVSQGALIAPLIAVDAGIIPVLAAITGLSENMIIGMAGAGGFTFKKLIDAACA